MMRTSLPFSSSNDNNLRMGLYFFSGLKLEKCSSSSSDTKRFIIHPQIFTMKRQKTAALSVFYSLTLRVNYAFY